MSTLLLEAQRVQREDFLSKILRVFGVNMNRREFLVVGVGALMVAGKKPSPKPTYVLELRYGRCYSIWVNGKRPDRGWDIQDTGPLSFNANWLEVNGLKVTDINIEWSGCGEAIPPVETNVEMVTSKGTFKGKISFVTTGSFDDDEGATKVKLFNGEELDVDETQLFLRVELS